MNARGFFGSAKLKLSKEDRFEVSLQRIEELGGNPEQFRKMAANNRISRNLLLAVYREINLLEGGDAFRNFVVKEGHSHERQCVATANATGNRCRRKVEPDLWKYGVRRCSKHNGCALAGLARYRARRQAQGLPLTSPRQALTYEQWQEGKRLKADGWTHKQLATHFGVSISTSEFYFGPRLRSRSRFTAHWAWPAETTPATDPSKL